MQRRNLYRIDDVLLRAGALTLVPLLGASALVAFGLIAPGETPPLESLVVWTLLFGLAWLCPLGLLGAGALLRRREKRIAAIWELLRRSAELPVKPLMANSDFTREDLERAVRFVNNRGLGHYVWDRGTDVIRDGRLDSSHIHIEVCDACGAEISIDVALTAREVPRCPYCQDPVSAGNVQERRRKALDRLQAEDRARRAPVRTETHVVRETRRERGDFSIGLFLLLLFVFWPGAVGYAIWKWHSGA